MGMIWPCSLQLSVDDIPMVFNKLK